MFIVEYHLLPHSMTGRQLPYTMRVVIKASGIAEAMEKFIARVKPGQDCTEVRIAECEMEED